MFNGAISKYFILFPIDGKKFLPSVFGFQPKSVWWSKKADLLQNLVCIILSLTSSVKKRVLSNSMLLRQTVTFDLINFIRGHRGARGVPGGRPPLKGPEGTFPPSKIQT